MDNQNPFGAGAGGFGAGGGGSPGGGYPGGGGVAPGALDVGDVISTAFRAMGPAIAPILGSALIIAVPTLVTMFVFQTIVYYVFYANGTPTLEQLEIGGVLGTAAYAVALVVLIVANAIGQGGIVYAVAEQLSGRRPTLGQALRVALSRAPQAILTGLLVGLPVVIGFVMCVVPGVAALTFLCVALPVCIVERAGPIDSLTRSVALTEGNRLSILLIGLAVFAGMFVVSCCLIGPVMGMITASAMTNAGDLTQFQAMQNPLSWQQLVMHLVQFPLGIVQAMVQGTVVAVIYARLRGLRDGVDAQAIASVFT